MSQAPRKEMLLTPIGEALHVHLSRPDVAYKPLRYKTKLVLDGPDRDALKASIDKLVDDAHFELTKDKPRAKAAKIGKHYPYEDVLDDEGNETGKVAFKFSMNAEINTKDDGVVERRPLLLDSKRIPLPKNAPPIFSGAMIRVAYTTRAYLNESSQKVGVTLDLHKVQVIKLPERSARPDNTFGEVDGGWTPETSFDDTDETTTSAGNEF